MSIGKFDETNEVEENVDNVEKEKNQILETPEDYDDDFDEKLDQNESKNDISGDDTKKSETDGSEESEKGSVLDRLRNWISKREGSEENDKADNSETENVQDTTSKREKFVNSFKVENSDNQIERQATENMEKKNEASGESDTDANENNNDISKEDGRSRAEEAYNRQFHVKDDER